MNIMKKIFIGLMFIIFVVCISTISNAATGIVTVQALNLRESPSTQSSVKTTIKKNDEVEILGKEGKWYQVKIRDITGYVHGDYIKIKEEVVEENNNTNEQEQENNNNQEQNQENQSNEIENKEVILEEITISKEVDIYILPVINSLKISKTKVNEKVSILSSTNKWLFISTDEVNGWITKASVADIIKYVPENNSSNNNTTNNNEEKTNNNNTEEQQNNIQNETTQEIITETETTQEENQTAQNTGFKEKTMYVNYASIYVRKGPGTNYDYIDTLVLNNSVLVIGEEVDWYKVKVDNKEGYIAKWLLADTKKNATSRGETSRSTENPIIVEDISLGEQIVNYAKQYLNCKYVYGASGPESFDCSGFTMFVYSKFGINLTHSALAQAKSGTYVAKEDLQPGDIVFFKDYETMEGIGHCGIYIGDGDFIHASSSAGNCVKISTLLSGSYDERYETARRLVK